MSRLIRITLFLVLMCLAGSLQAQTLRRFSGRVNISTIDYISATEYTIKGSFTDQSGFFQASNASASDRIIDNRGNSFEILEVSASGSTLTVKVKVLNGTGPAFGVATIYTPTEFDLPLVTNEVPDMVLVSTLNSAALTLDNKIPKYQTGSVLPSSSFAVGDVVKLSTNGQIYKLSSTGWNQVSEAGIGTSYAANAGLIPPGQKGDMIKLFFESYKVYIYNGTEWKAPTEISSLPVPSKYGDIFFVTGENKLYMYDANDRWAALGGALGGSTLPPSADAKPGDIFFNQSDSRLYVYNGTDWIPLDNSLEEGKIYVGNASGVAVASDKSSIALNELGTPQAAVSMGDHALTQVADPTDAQDAATKNYVDTKTADPASMSLPEGNILVGNAEGKASPVAKNTIAISELGAAGAAVSMGSNPLTDLAEPADAQDAATKNYVDTKTADPASMSLAEGNILVGGADGKAAAVAKNSIAISDLGAAGAVVSMGNNALTNVAEPSAAQDAATKNYVDTKTFDASAVGLAEGNILVGGADGKAAAVAKNSIAISDLGAAGAAVSMGNNALTNVAEPSAAQDAATKNYVDTKTFDASAVGLAEGNILVGGADGKAAAVAKNSIAISDLGAAGAAVSMGNNALTNVAEPGAAQDAATKNYVDTKTADPASMSLAEGNILMGGADGKAASVAKNTIAISDLGAATASVSMGNNKLADLAEPTVAQDAATKNYVDTKIIDPASINMSTGDILINNGSGQAVSVAKNTIPLSGFDRAAADIAMGDGTSNFKITRLADPQEEQDAATKNYVDTKVADPSSISLSDGSVLIGNAANKAAAQVISGDISLSNAGVATIANDAVGTAHLKDSSVTLEKLVTSGAADANKVFVTDSAGVPVLADRADFSGGSGAAERFADDFVVNGVPNYLKWTNGQTVPAKGKTAIELLLEGSQMAVAPNYSAPTTSISGSPGPGNFEFGKDLGTISLSSTFSQNDAGALISTTYSKDGVALSGNTDIIASLIAPVTYTVTKTYGEGPVKNNNLGEADPTGRIPAGSVSKSITYTPVASRYYGFVSSTSPSDAEIQALTKDQTNSKVLKTTLTNPSTPKYICFRYPAAAGALTAIKVNGFSAIGAFTITVGQFTNENGYQSSYYLVIGNNPVDNSGAPTTDLDLQ